MRVGPAVVDDGDRGSFIGRLFQLGKSPTDFEMPNHAEIDPTR